MKIKIIHEPTKIEPFLIFEKPAGLASAPLKKSAASDTAIFEAIKLFPEIKNVRSKNWRYGSEKEFGLLHRLDTATCGLLLAASSQEFYDHMILAQKNGEFLKTYFAECDIDAKNAKKLGGFPKLLKKPFFDFSSAILQKTPQFFFNAVPQQKIASDFVLSSYFRSYGKGKKEVRPVLDFQSGFVKKKVGKKKLYSTKIEFENEKFCFEKVSQKNFLKGEGRAKIFCTINEGFRHQVRCHLAWLGFPVVGDAVYNYEFCASFGCGTLCKKGAENDMRFFAEALEFPDLYSDKKFRFARRGI